MAIVKVRDDMVCIREEAMKVLKSVWILMDNVTIKFGNISNYFTCIIM